MIQKIKLSLLEFYTIWKNRDENLPKIKEALCAAPDKFRSLENKQKVTLIGFLCLIIVSQTYLALA